MQEGSYIPKEHPNPSLSDALDNGFGLSGNALEFAVREALSALAANEFTRAKELLNSLLDKVSG
jgi:hypothetical protein